MSSASHKDAGRHAWADLYECGELVDATIAIGRVLVHVCEKHGAKVLEVRMHRFEPHGCTAVAILAESHATIHTYPEHRTAFVDAFTCGEAVDPALIVDELRLLFEAKTFTSGRIQRGGRGVGSDHVEVLRDQKVCK